MHDNNFLPSVIWNCNGSWLMQIRALAEANLTWNSPCFRYPNGGRTLRQIPIIGRAISSRPTLSLPELMTFGSLLLANCQAFLKGNLFGFPQTSTGDNRHYISCVNKTESLTAYFVNATMRLVPI